VLGIGIRGPARDKRYLNPLLSKHHPLKESTAKSESGRKEARRKKRRVLYSSSISFINSFPPAAAAAKTGTFRLMKNSDTSTRTNKYARLRNARGIY
jgi:hypothetical protein